MQQPLSQRLFFKDYLPTFDSSFVGRRSELQAIASALESRSFLTIVGPGGIGKTRLAVQAALDMAEPLRNGIAFVPLASVTSRDAFVTMLMSVLHLQVGGKDDQFERALGYLSQREILLVLDNVEQLLNHVDLISRLVSLDGPKWIVTSRERLGLPEEIVLNLRGLTRLDGQYSLENELPPAERLFVQSMRTVNHRFHPSEHDISHIQRICQLTEGMPLAIELAASWTRLLPVSFVADQIANNLDWLTSSLSITRGPQRSIRAVLDYFWGLLSVEEQTHVCELAVFQGGFERDMAESFAHVSFFFLSALVQQAFLSRTASGRYQLHEMLRQYAVERLLRVPEIAHQTYRRHAQLMCDLVDPIPASAGASKTDLTQRQAWIERMLVELPNIRVALDWAAENNEVSIMLALLLPLKNLWLSVANNAELCEWIDVLLQSHAQLSAPQRVAINLLGSQCAEAISQFERAAQYVHAVLQHAQLLNDSINIVAADCLLCMLAYRQGRFDEAQHHADLALTVAKRFEEANLISQAMRSVGMVLSARGDYVHAVQYEQESLKIARELKDPVDIASSLNSAAVDMAWLGKHDEAVAYLLESLEIHRQLNYLDRVSVSLMNLGWLYHLKQDPLQAEMYYRQSLEILRQTGDLDGLALTHLNMGDSMLARHAAVQEIAAHYRTGLNTALRIQAWPTVMYGLIDTAKLAVATQNWQLATQMLGVVLSQSTANDTAHTDSKSLLTQIQQHCQPDVVQRWLSEGQAQSLDVALAQANQFLDQTGK